MKTCETCKYWERLEPLKVTKTISPSEYDYFYDKHYPGDRDEDIFSVHKLPFGKCKSDKFLYKFHPYQLNHGTGKVLIVESDKFVYCDYESYEASFKTGKDFGCIHHDA